MTRYQFSAIQLQLSVGSTSQVLRQQSCADPFAEKRFQVAYFSYLQSCYQDLQKSLDTKTKTFGQGLEIKTKTLTKDLETKTKTLCYRKVSRATVNDKKCQVQ